MLEVVVQNFDKTLGPDSQFTGISTYDLASALLHAGHDTESVEAARRAVQSMARSMHTDTDKAELWRSQLLLADALVQSKQPREGLALGEQTLATAAAALGAGAAALLEHRELLADAYLHAGDPARAEALLRENLVHGKNLANRPAWLVGQLEASLGGALLAQHRRAEAGPLLEDALQILSSELGPNNRRTVLAKAGWQQLQ